MRMGRPKLVLILTPEEQETLERWARRPKSAQALAQRARIVLVCAQGKSNTAVAAELGWGAQTVGKWRARFVARRLNGLLDEPRPGAPRHMPAVCWHTCRPALTAVLLFPSAQARMMRARNARD